VPALLRFVSAAVLLLISAAICAQTYPTRPVRILVGSTAGGGTDIIARLIAEKLGDAFKQTFIVENRPGASTTIAGLLAAKATPDGYTLLVGTATARAVGPHIYKLGYDANRELAPIALLVTVPNVLIVNNALPAKNVRELVSLVRAKPDQYTMGNAGLGTVQHFAGEFFKQRIGVKTVNVAYKGSAPALVDLVAGHIQLAFDTTSSSIGQIRGGRVRPLASTSAKRLPELPDVPTMAEAGYPGFEFATWYAMWSTGGTPRAMIARLHNETMRALRMPDVQQRLSSLGGEIGTMDVDQFAAFARAEYDRYGKLVREMGIKVQE
jgi:tripartite-type tricarboxylate transporter receptor subunit TctC